MKPQHTWIIKDWAGNVKFSGKVFKAFEDAQDHLYEYIDSLQLSDDEWEETVGEYYIEETQR